MTDREILIKGFDNAVKEMRRTHDNGTYYWLLGEDKKGNDWAIVLGWCDGFDEYENDDCIDGTYRICTKLAYQPNNSLLQCDYEYDWIMPYDEETNEVDDNEVAIYPDTKADEVVDWLLKCYSVYME